jgi:glutathione S-transferase
MLLSELNIPVTLTEDKPWTWPDALLSINPSGDLPVLTTADGDVVCGSYAISEWLSDDAVKESPHIQVDQQERNAHPGAVFPGNAMERAEVRRIVDWFHGKMFRDATTFLIEEKVYKRFHSDGGGAPDPEILRSAQANMAVHIRYIDFLTTSRKWLAGETLSFADLAAAGQLSCVDYLGGIGWGEHEAAKLWYARLKSRPSFRKILAERVPGAPLPPDDYDDPDF